ncbi:MAG: biotin--[acetyl-CoA-carboxylase] ligase [Calditrichota bacterium]
MDSQLIRTSLSADEIIIHTYDVLESTNTTLGNMALEGAGEWTVVTANKQSAGRGRYKRIWHSGSGKGLYFSFLLRPSIPPRYYNLINLFTALQLADFLSEQLNLSGCRKKVDMKWPNDIYVEGKKLCGILLEGSLISNKIGSLIIGIGINVAHLEEDWPEELKANATSLKQICPSDWCREELLAGFMNLFYKKFYQQFPHKMDDIVQLYWEKVMNQHQEIRVRTAGKDVIGFFTGLTREGYMRLSVDGAEQVIATGELFPGLPQRDL